MKLYWVLVITLFSIMLHATTRAQTSQRFLAPVNDEYLKHFYDEYNDIYFGGNLPQDTSLIYAPDPKDSTYIGSTSCSLDPITNKPFKCVIHIAPYANKARATAAETMIHEMCHIHTYQNGLVDKDNGHGKEWTNCMMGMAREGGFNGIW